MVQIVEQTDEEKLAMYLKCSKKELAKMVIECNRIIKARALEIKYEPADFTFCNHEWVSYYSTSQPFRSCKKCGAHEQLWNGTYSHTYSSNIINPR